MSLFLNASIVEKTPSDVFSVVMLLKHKIIQLRLESGIKTKLPKAPVQYNKKPRHVIQKSLEVLTKIDKYRKNKNFGEISMPLYPSRQITPSDVFYIVERLNQEVFLLLENKKLPNTPAYIKYKNKESNDVYKELWELSLGFDELLGQGFTPTDVYEQSEKIIKIVNYLQSSQGIILKKDKPHLKENQHPNHALYASIHLMSKISNSQKKLWIEPMEVPSAPQRVITPTEVYDSLQIVIAELQRIKRRIGVERYFEIEEVTNEKTPADVVQNLEYIISIFPSFSLQRNLKQFEVTSLEKNSNDIYSLSAFILKKLMKLKELKGVRVKPKFVPKLYGLKNIHTYEKIVENLEKVNRIKEEHGMLSSYIPSSLSRNITPGQIYELVLRLDDEMNILLNAHGVKNAIPWTSVLEKQISENKTSSDVYHNLSKISNLFDAILGLEYTPNETYVLAKQIEYKIDLISMFLNKKNNHLVISDENKQPSDVFDLSLEVYTILNKIQKRANIPGELNIIIPKDKIVTPTTVYNSLRLINAATNVLRLNFNIEEKIHEDMTVTNKTPSDVYGLLQNIKGKLLFLLEDKNYEN